MIWKVFHKRLEAPFGGFKFTAWILSGFGDFCISLELQPINFDMPDLTPLLVH